MARPMIASARELPIPELVDTHRAAEILGRSAATLKRWRCEGTGPSWIEIEGRVDRLPTERHAEQKSHRRMTYPRSDHWN